MASSTKNFKLNKPDGTDFYNIELDNQNMDTIDGELKRLGDGLDEVESPVYTESESLTTLESGEKIPTAFGKIKKAISTLVGHLSAATPHVTSTERTNWNGKSPGGRGVGELTKVYSSDFIDMVKNGGGFYVVSNATDSPTGSTNWLNLIQLSKEYTEGVGKETAIQIVPDSLSAGKQDLWYRSIFSGYAYDWKKILHSGNYADFANAKIQMGSYDGHGDYGASAPNTLTFNFKPQLLIVDLAIMFQKPDTRFLDIYSSNPSKEGSVTWGDNSVSWYSEYSTLRQCSGTGKHYYIAFG